MQKQISRAARSVANQSIKAVGKAALQTAKQIPILEQAIDVVQPIVSDQVRKRRKRRSRPKSQTSANSMAVTTAPVALGTMVKTAKPKVTSIPDGSRYSYTIAPGDLTPGSAKFGGPNFVNDPAEYRIYEYRLSPLDAEVYQVLPQHAVLYKKFRFKGFRLRWAPVVPSTTSGKISVLYQANGFTPLPAQYITLSNSSDNVQHSLWQPFDYNVSAKQLNGNDPTKTYTVSIVPPRQSTGDYGATIPPDIISSLQGSMLIAVQGLPSNFGLNVSIGTMYIDVDVEFFESAPALANLSAAITPNIDIDMSFPYLSTANPILSRFWFRSSVNPLRWYYQGSSTRFDLDVTIVSAFAIAPLLFYDSSGTPLIPATTFDSWVGTTSGGDNVAHFDGTQVLTFGDYFEIPSYVAAKLSFVLTSSGETLSTRFA